MARKTVLVTGAGGFIGRWSVPKLIDAGFEVHAVAARAAGGAPPAQLRGAVLHAADLLMDHAASDLMRVVRPSHLLHFAWIAAPGIYWNSPENYRWLAASQALLTYFRAEGGVRAVMAGSCAEYDWTQGGLCNERASPLADAGGASITAYAQCKIAMQRRLADVGAADGVSTAWGRIFFQFGPAEHPDRVVASVIRSLLAGRVALCSHGRQIRSFLHVADVGSAFAALLDSAVEGPVNIGSGAGLPLAAVLEEIGTQIGRPDLIRLGARGAAVSEPALLVPDIARLAGEVGWRPQWTLSDGLADTIAWWREELRTAGEGWSR